MHNEVTAKYIQQHKETQRYFKYLRNNKSKFIMILQFKIKFILLSALTIVTLLLSWLIISITDQEIRNAFMVQTQIGANSISVKRIKNLTGTISDLKSPDYLELKKQLANIKKVDDNLHFVYLMGIHKKGKIFFYVDDKPDGHPEGSSPGSAYDEAPKEFTEVIQTGNAVVQGPSSDSWGSYVSGCAPVIDPNTGKTIAIFAIDFATSPWYWKIFNYAALPLGLVFFLYLGLISMLVSSQRGKLLKKSEEKYRFMFENNPLPMWIYNVETLEFLEVNQAAIKHYGYSKEEFISMALKDIRPAEDIPALFADIKRANTSYYKTGEWKHIKKNGEIIFVEATSQPLIYDGINARHALIYDITDRKLAENALKQANDELEKLHNNLDEAVFSIDLINDKMNYASFAHQTVFGHAPDEFMKSPSLLYEIIIPEDKHIVDEQFPHLYAGERIDFEFRIADPDGQFRWIETKIKPTLNEKGSLIRIDGIAFDITLRKKIENELLKSEINFRRSISESPLGIRIVSEDGDTVYTNKAFLDLYEFNSLDEFNNTPAINRYTPESYIQHQLRKKKRSDGLEVFEYEISINCKNGDIRHLKVSRKETLWNGELHFQIINQDITEQRKAEEELRKLSTAVEQSPNAECITNTEGVIEYVNPTTIELTGYLQEELIGKKTSIFGSGEKPKEEYAELWKTIKSGKVWSGELHNKKKNGELYWESTTISPIFDKWGKITHFLAIKVDITERKRVETALINSEEQLRKFTSHLQHVREEEKIAIAREIHDDIGQILVALKIDVGMYKRKISNGIEHINQKEILYKFDEICEMVDRTIKTTRRIMNGLRPEMLDTLGFVDATKSYLFEFEERYRICCQFINSVSESNINPQQSLALFRILQESLANIIKHAKATAIKVQFSHIDDNLIMEVVDNGVGFDQNNSGRKDSYGILGMKERVVLLNGSLIIISELGHGTTIKVEIPVIN